MDAGRSALDPSKVLQTIPVNIQPFTQKQIGTVFTYLLSIAGLSLCFTYINTNISMVLAHLLKA